MPINAAKEKNASMRFSTKKQEQYIITRPRLKMFLEEQGFECEETQNPFTDRLRAWAFPLSRELAEQVWMWYTERELPVPFRITEYLRTVEW